MTTRPHPSNPGPGRSASREPGTVTVSTPSSLAAAIPHLLGFRPRRSLVLVLLQAACDRVHVTLRADLLGPEDIDPGTGQPMTLSRWAEMVAQRTVFSPGRRALVAVYPDPAPTPEEHLPHAQDVEAIRVALATRGIDSLREYCLGPDRWWDYRTAGTAQAGEGRPLDDSAALQVRSDLVLAGSGFADSREVLEQSLDPDSPLVQGRVAVVLAQVEARVAGLISGQAVLPADAPRGALLERLPDGRERPFVPRQVDVAAYEDWRDLTLAALAEAVAPDSRSEGRLGSPPPDTLIASVVFGLHDVRVRDTWLWDLVRGTARPDRERAALLLGHCVRRAPADWIAPAATCAAICWWTLGNGAMAGIALDRALGSDPGYSLALLVREAIEHGMPPDTYQEAMAGLTRDECRTGRPPQARRRPGLRRPVSGSETGERLLDADREVG